MRYLTSLLSFFLLFASCVENNETGDRTVTSGAVERAIFERIPSSVSNVTFSNHVEENYKNFFARFQYVYNGGGVAIGDIDEDGLQDVYFTANEQPNRLYRNTGNMTFEDITETAGVGGAGGWDNGVVMADVNGDGKLDIYVCRGGSAEDSRPEDRENLLFLNDGGGKFHEAAAELGLADAGYSLQAVFFDMDNDNDLDAYVTNRPSTFFIPYAEVLEAKKKQNPDFSDQLYRNDDGKYIRITEDAGITGNFGYGLGLVTADVNNDGFTDILVSNDYLENDYLYENQGDGTFAERIERYTNHTSFYGMGIDATDLNNDGYEDLIQLDMSPEDYVRSKTTMASMNVEIYRQIMASGFHDQYMHNSLQLNRGNGFFSEISQYAGIAKSDWSWATLGADFDNDGDKEIFITNGYRRDVADKDGNIEFRKYLAGAERRKKTDEENAAHVIGLFNSVPLQNYLYDGSGDLRYRNVAGEWGLTEESFSNGAAYGDLDNDGDLDLVVNNLEANAFVYRNDGAAADYLRLHLAGPVGNAHGIGAKVTVEFSDGSRQFQQVKTVRGYLSSVEPMVHFGLGTSGPVSRLRVAWPDGKESVIENLTVNQVLTVAYADASEGKGERTAVKQLLRETTAARFAEVPRHTENEFDDYRSQVLLPHGHSRSGPAIAVGDVNGDGTEDFYFGGAKGFAGGLMRQTKDGRFVGAPAAFALADKKMEDVTAAFFDADGDGDLDLYVGSGGSEFTPDNKNLQDRLYLNDGAGGFTRSGWLPKMRTSTSSVVPHDVDGDGDLDLFVGGRVVPAHYPAAPRSYLLENTGTGYVDATAKSAPGLSTVGMVTDAAWADVNGDGDAELIVVGEWMPITIFGRKGKTFENRTVDYDLGETQGWWNTIVPADLDGDGDTDFVVGNLGLNYKFTASKKKPFYVFATDFDRNGSNDIFLAKENGDDLVPIRGRECSSQQIPGIADKFPTYNAFADAELGEIIDLERKDAVRYVAREFAGGVLENREGRLVFRPLPPEAQFSVINGVVVTDLNGDGTQDLVTAGNKFEVEIETTRADAGVGTVLLGGKDLNYTSVSPTEAGLFLPLNVKGLYPIRTVKGGNGMLVAVNDGTLRMLEW